MATYAERVVDIAEGEVGVREWGRPNRGGCEKYQRPWGSWMIGQAWCGAWVAWVWSRANLDGMHLASPSTQQMCNIARARDLECSPRPGAAFVICGTHTGLVVYAMGGGVYKTIEGNSGDAVRWRQRSLSGLVVYGPPQISGGSAEAPPAQVTWYYLEDVAMRGVREWGGWSTKAGRNGRQRIEEKRLGKQLRPFKREFPSRKSPFFFEDVSQPERFYGGWRSQEARNDAQVRLQRQLGRNLRRFSAKRAISEADADELGKID